MDSSKPGGQNAEADPELALNQALRLEIPRNPPRNCLTASLLVHAVSALALFFAGWRSGYEIEQRAAHEVVTPLFAPALFRPAPPVSSRPILTEEPPQVLAEAPSGAVSTVAVDLSAIRLSFPPDIRNQLPAVVAAQGGVLALLDKD